MGISADQLERAHREGAPLIDGETVTFIWAGEKAPLLVADFADWEENPISLEESHLRASLLPGLLRRVERNFARGVRDVRLFELGTCFFDVGEEERPREETRLGLVATGRRRPPHWSGEDEAVDLWDLKGWVEELTAAAVGPGGAVRPEAPEDGLFEAGQGFTVEAEARGAVGRAGRVRAGAVDAPPWAHAVWALELVLPAEPEGAPVPRHEPLPSFPGVDRDLALLVPDGLPVESVRRTIRDAGGSLLESVDVFDLYRGEGVPPGIRSVAFRLHFSSPDRTLTDEDVDDATESIVRNLKEELGVEPRG